MQIERVTVRVGKTIPGPEYGGNQYANVKPEIEITAAVMAGESTENVVMALSEQAKRALEFVAGELIGRPIQPKTLYAQQPAIVSVPQPPAPPPQNLNQGGTWTAVGAAAAPQPPPPPQPPGIPAIDPVTW